jgi:transposase
MNKADLPREAQDYISQLEAQNLNWAKKYQLLEEKLALALHRQFGRKAENVPDQIELFDTEETSVPDEPSEEEAINSYKRKKKGRKPLDENLPRKERIIDIPDEEKSCACGTELRKIGEEVSEKLHVIPPRIWVERIIRLKYACQNCEGTANEDAPTVKIAPQEPSIIPKGIATPGLLAFLMVNKYVDHLPFYRQEKRFERMGARISRQNMSNWQKKSYEALIPLFELLKKHIKSGSVLQMDETTVQVLNEPGRNNEQKSYMWLARGGPPGQPAVYYEYHPTRASVHAKNFLIGFKGYLQTDGYQGYKTAVEGNPDIHLVGCFAHARRKFFEADKASKKSKSALEGIKHIKKLYALENELRSKDLSPEDFLKERKSKAEPVLERLKQWLDKRAENVLPESALGKAVHYAVNQWDFLIRYLESPYLTPDNNASENAIRPFVLGRKNWLFSGNPKGADSSCAMYSLVETAKQNDLNPFDYLHFVFSKAPLISNEQGWEALLPWNIKEDITADKGPVFI